MPPKSKKQKAYQFGHMAEFFAGAFLFLKGYRILAWRYKTTLGEVDLIAQKGKALVFIEVKARKNQSDAAEAITSHQKKRIIGAARAYLAANPKAINYFCRFDAILVAPWQLPTHIEDAWQSGGDQAF